MSCQMDWDRLWINIDKRKELTAGLPADRRVIALLHALDDFAQTCPRTVVLPGGSIMFCMTIRDVQNGLQMAAQSARNYIKLAKKTTRYLSVTESTYSANTFVIHWPAIVDDSRPAVKSGDDVRALSKRCGPTDDGKLAQGSTPSSGELGWVQTHALDPSKTPS